MDESENVSEFAARFPSGYVHEVNRLIYESPAPGPDPVDAEAWHSNGKYFLTLEGKLHVVMVMGAVIVLPSLLVFLFCYLRDKRRRRRINRQLDGTKIAPAAPNTHAAGMSSGLFAGNPRGLIISSPGASSRLSTPTAPNGSGRNERSQIRFGWRGAPTREPPKVSILITDENT